MTIDIHQLCADEVWDHSSGERFSRQPRRRALGRLEGNSGERRHIRILPFLLPGSGKPQLGETADGGLAELLGPGLPILGYISLELGKVREIDTFCRFSHGA